MFYNPLIYARKSYDRYLELYGGCPKEVVLIGMNPGPWGMAQIGVPFGAIPIIRDWLGINEPVERPDCEHPKRPIQGFDCPRVEVSGARLWGWARDTFHTPETFFQRFFIANYCPLCFMEESGRNHTPNKLPVNERTPLFEVCDRALRRTIEYLQPKYAIGIGQFAETRTLDALDGMDVQIGRILHPSPASPIANRGWAEAAVEGLKGMGVGIG